MADRGLFWSTSTGLATFLEAPDDQQETWPDALSGDGSVIVGWYLDADSVTIPARWDNGALTVLVAVSGADGAWAVNCNQDASIIIGQNSSRAVYWSGGGTTGHLLDIGVSGSTSNVTQCSDDGSIICGTVVTNDAVRHAVYWTNGTLTTLPNSVTGSAFILNCSFDGSIIAGYVFTDGGNVPCYWQGTTQYLLATGGHTNLHPIGVSGDGTIIYGLVEGNVDPNTACYWDNLDTLSGGVYGTFHVLDEGVGNGTGHPPFAFGNPGTVAGGYIVTGDDINIAARWFDFAPVQCEFLAGWALSQTAIVSGPANPAISGDGNILAGNFRDADFNEFACFWDAESNYNALQIPDGYSSTTAMGISRDGSTVRGQATPAPPQPELKLVSLYPMDVDNGDTYAFANDSNADFPSSFSQFSISVWCCEHVNIRAPNGVDAPFILDIAISPTDATIAFVDDSLAKRFDGTFHNPGSAPNLYHLMFSVDTEAETYTMWVSGVQWTTTDAAFSNTA